MVLTGCPTPPPVEEGGLEDGSTLSGTLTQDVTLTKGNTYYLDGEYIVPEGITLNIEEGVTIIAKYDDIVDYLLVKQGGKINAVGTADAPIVMTSEKKESGAWGGIHLCGKARTNAEGGTGSSEIGGAPYGGTEDNDNSGCLSYVRVEYTGYAFDEEHEANGITFYAVGNGTVVDHCEAYMGADDGFEWCGGCVIVSYLVAKNCSDDSFDWTEGWTGNANYLVAYQENAETLGYDCDCLIEADNNENNYIANPTSHPIISNATLVGNGGAKQGIRLRRGTQVNLATITVCGKGIPVSVESTETEQAFVDGVSSMKNVTASAELTSEKGIYTNDNFINDGNKVDASLSLSYDDILKNNSWMSGAWVK
ncbi:MAG: hypothetical protein KIG42_06410 [Paludibacteraceae bacterium]|nr:hypothetical protein [Paludibacteraceae bacterium]